jgi:aspartyl-tRNA(Asn)/glutamyl-tRNA(Gln) amidotransferase subunit C
MVSREEVRRVARLAKLTLSAEDEERLAPQLARILEYVELLRDLDAEPLPLDASDLPARDPVTRPDELAPSLPRADVLALAPASDGETFLVPPVLDRGGEE